MIEIFKSIREIRRLMAVISLRGSDDPLTITAVSEVRKGLAEIERRCLDEIFKHLGNREKKGTS